MFLQTSVFAFFGFCVSLKNMYVFLVSMEGQDHVFNHNLSCDLKPSVNGCYKFLLQCFNFVLFCLFHGDNYLPVNHNANGYSLYCVYVAFGLCSNLYDLRSYSYA